MKTQLLALTALLLASLATGCTNHELVGVEYEHYTGGDDEDIDDEDDPSIAIPVFPDPEPYCGDANLDEGEECDDGELNDDFGACTHECRINVCGDGLVFEGVEQCDDGELNGSEGNLCSDECTLPQ